MYEQKEFVEKLVRLSPKINKLTHYFVLTILNATYECFKIMTNTVLGILYCEV